MTPAYVIPTPSRRITNFQLINIIHQEHDKRMIYWKRNSTAKSLKTCWEKRRIINLWHFMAMYMKMYVVFFSPFDA